MSLATQPLSELNNQLRFAHIRVAKPMATLFYDEVIGDFNPCVILKDMHHEVDMPFLEFFAELVILHQELGERGGLQSEGELNITFIDLGGQGSHLFSREK